MVQLQAVNNSLFRIQGLEGSSHLVLVMKYSIFKLKWYLTIATCTFVHLFLYPISYSSTWDTLTHVQLMLYSLLLLDTDRDTTTGAWGQPVKLNYHKWRVAHCYNIILCHKVLNGVGDFNDVHYLIFHD